jgi:hypothetical protein
MRFGNFAITLVATIVISPKALSHAAFHSTFPGPQGGRNPGIGRVSFGRQPSVHRLSVKKQV